LFIVHRLKRENPQTVANTQGERRCRPAITGNSGTLNEPVVKKINLISFQFGTRNLPTVSL
ncbi:hypothetical protein, partial [Klebsiella pneumoniae]|uniref:hypothetical protein n=1 Tax=Klebsiella pneumoniae TaxID=573 RepID=UPI001D0D8907